jgi:hypothetical protein
MEPVVEKRQIPHRIQGRLAFAVTGTVVGVAVGPVVIGEDDKAMGVQKPGKVVIAGAVLAKTVADLDNTPGVLHILPQPGKNFFSVK